MSKPARPTLSDVLPSKGAATRPEPMPDQPAIASTPIAEGRGKTPRVQRVPITVKISEPVYKRLREAAFREETDKQDLVDQGLDELLTRMGY
jgi:hypothetical protein